MKDGVDLTRYDSEGAAPLVEGLVALYLDVYADADPSFFNEDRYRRQLAGHIAAPRWELVTAIKDSKLVGYIYGFALPASTRWWAGLRTDVPEDFTTEDGARTVAISEILVQAACRRHGIGRALHDEFLGGRAEERATLLVEPDNAPALVAYSRWGWKRNAELQPSWHGAPLYRVLVRSLA